MAVPNQRGYFGEYGGRFVPETLMTPLLKLQKAYEEIKAKPEFAREFNELLTQYAGRPTPLYFAKNLTEHYRGAKIYLKREDLLHTGAHKINNTIGQALLAKFMGKTKIIAETGAGQHGVATATVAALLGLSCKIFMGKKDIERQTQNVYKMKLLGSEVISCDEGSQSLKDAVNATFRYWMGHPDDTFYIVGSAMGPHPYPQMVRDFQTVIGYEVRQQISKIEKRMPDLLMACVGGGSNSIGLFYPFIKDESVKMMGVEAAGEGLRTNHYAATLAKGQVGIFHGSKSYVLQDKDHQITEAHSISAGLDYPGIGPEHAYLHDSGRAEYVSITDEEALEGVQLLSHLEGIIPALESAHAIAQLKKVAPRMKKNKIIVLNLSGRGDKDLATYQRVLKL
jgi:tryptophan synthase beta chain